MPEYERQLFKKKLSLLKYPKIVMVHVCMEEKKNTGGQKQKFSL